MANKRLGRPVDGHPLIFFNVSIGLHPIRHAHIIAKINAAPKGRKSAVIVDMLEHGADAPTVTAAEAGVRDQDVVDVEIDLDSDGL